MLSEPLFDLSRPLSLIDRMLGEVQMRGAKIRLRNFGIEDRLFIERLRKNKIDITTIWDIGASNGAWSMMVGQHFLDAKLHLFEPLVCFDKTYCDSMRYCLHRFPNWTSHQVALGFEDGEAEIFIPEMSYGSTLLASEYARQEWRSITVPVRSISSVVKEGNVPPANLLKIDTQGYELAILEGADSSLEGVNALILETWLSRDYGVQTPLFGELSDWLIGRGFRPIDIVPGYRMPTGWMHSADIYFVSEDAASKLGYYF